MTPRQRIRKAFRDALLGKTVAADRVMTNRASPLSQRPSAQGGKEDLPAILIYTRSERSEVFDESPRRYRRTTEVVVELGMEVNETSEIDDDLDAFADQVENCVLADESLGGLVNDTLLTGSTLTLTDVGAKLIGAAILAFDVDHFTDAPLAQPSDNLRALHTEHSLANKQPDGRDRAVTQLEELDA